MGVKKSLEEKKAKARSLLGWSRSCGENQGRQRHQMMPKGVSGSLALHNI